jgi:hypothetical protein
MQWGRWQASKSGWELATLSSGMVPLWHDTCKKEQSVVNWVRSVWEGQTDRYHTLPWQCSRGECHKSHTVLCVWWGHGGCCHPWWSCINSGHSNVGPACQEFFHNSIRSFRPAALAVFPIRAESIPEPKQCKHILNSKTQLTDYWWSNPVAMCCTPHWEIPFLLKVHCDKCLPLKPVLWQFNPLHILKPISVWCIVILFFHLHLGLGSDLFPWVVIKYMNVFYIFPWVLHFLSISLLTEAHCWILSRAHQSSSQLHNLFL